MAEGEKPTFKETFLIWVRNGVVAIIAGLTSAVVYLFNLLLECYSSKP